MQLHYAPDALPPFSNHHEPGMAEPDLNLLFALDALLAEKNVTRAAKALRLSASAMSRTLARLREATGDPLLVRAGRDMVLTPYAEAMHERTRNLIHEARALLSPSPVEPDFSTLQRTFRIRANEAFVEAFGATLIAEITAAAPRVRLHFSSRLEKNAEYLRNGTSDLEIGVLEEMGPEIRVRALFRDHYLGVVKKGASTRIRTPCHRRELRRIWSCRRATWPADYRVSGCCDCRAWTRANDHCHRAEFSGRSSRGLRVGSDRTSAGVLCEHSAQCRRIAFRLRTTHCDRWLHDFANVASASGE